MQDAAHRALTGVPRLKQTIVDALAAVKDSPFCEATVKQQVAILIALCAASPDAAEAMYDLPVKDTLIAVLYLLPYSEAIHIDVYHLFDYLLKDFDDLMSDSDVRMILHASHRYVRARTAKACWGILARTRVKMSTDILKDSYVPAFDHAVARWTGQAGVLAHVAGTMTMAATHSVPHALMLARSACFRKIGVEALRVTDVFSPVTPGPPRADAGAPPSGDGALLPDFDTFLEGETEDDPPALSPGSCVSEEQLKESEGLSYCVFELYLHVSGIAPTAVRHVAGFDVVTQGALAVSRSHDSVYLGQSEQIMALIDAKADLPDLDCTNELLCQAGSDTPSMRVAAALRRLAGAVASPDIFTKLFSPDALHTLCDAITAISTAPPSPAVVSVAESLLLIFAVQIQTEMHRSLFAAADMTYAAKFKRMFGPLKSLLAGLGWASNYVRAAALRALRDFVRVAPAGLVSDQDLDGLFTTLLSIVAAEPVNSAVRKALSDLCLEVGCLSKGRFAPNGIATVADLYRVGATRGVADTPYIALNLLKLLEVPDIDWGLVDLANVSSLLSQSVSTFNFASKLGDSMKYVPWHPEAKDNIAAGITGFIIAEQNFATRKMAALAQVCRRKIRTHASVVENFRCGDLRSVVEALACLCVFKEDPELASDGALDEADAIAAAALSEAASTTEVANPKVWSTISELALQLLHDRPPQALDLCTCMSALFRNMGRWLQYCAFPSAAIEYLKVHAAVVASGPVRAQADVWHAAIELGVGRSLYPTMRAVLDACEPPTSLAGLASQGNADVQTDRPSYDDAAVACARALAPVLDSRSGKDSDMFDLIAKLVRSHAAASVLVEAGLLRSVADRISEAKTPDDYVAGESAIWALTALPHGFMSGEDAEVLLLEIVPWHETLLNEDTTRLIAFSEDTPKHFLNCRARLYHDAVGAVREAADLSMSREEVHIDFDFAGDSRLLSLLNHDPLKTMQQLKAELTYLGTIVRTSWPSVMGLLRGDIIGALCKAIVQHSDDTEFLQVANPLIMLFLCLWDRTSIVYRSSAGLVVTLEAMLVLRRHGDDIGPRSDMEWLAYLSIVMFCTSHHFDVAEHILKEVAAAVLPGLRSPHGAVFRFALYVMNEVIRRTPTKSAAGPYLADIIAVLGRHRRSDNRVMACIMGIKSTLKDPASHPVWTSTIAADGFIRVLRNDTLRVSHAATVAGIICDSIVKEKHRENSPYVQIDRLKVLLSRFVSITALDDFELPAGDLYANYLASALVTTCMSFSAARLIAETGAVRALVVSCAHTVMSRGPHSRTTLKRLLLALVQLLKIIGKKDTSIKTQFASAGGPKLIYCIVCLPGALDSATLTCISRLNSSAETLIRADSCLQHEARMVADLWQSHLRTSDETVSPVRAYAAAVIERLLQKSRFFQFFCKKLSFFTPVSVGDPFHAHMFEITTRFHKNSSFTPQGLASLRAKISATAKEDIPGTPAPLMFAQWHVVRANIYGAPYMKDISPPIHEELVRVCSIFASGYEPRRPSSHGQAPLPISDLEPSRVVAILRLATCLSHAPGGNSRIMNLLYSLLASSVVPGGQLGVSRRGTSIVSFRDCVSYIGSLRPDVALDALYLQLGTLNTLFSHCASQAKTHPGSAAATAWLFRRLASHEGTRTSLRSRMLHVLTDILSHNSVLQYRNTLRAAADAVAFTPVSPDLFPGLPRAVAGQDGAARIVLTRGALLVTPAVPTRFTFVFVTEDLKWLVCKNPRTRTADGEVRIRTSAIMSVRSIPVGSEPPFELNGTTASRLAQPRFWELSTAAGPSVYAADAETHDAWVAALEALIQESRVLAV